MAIGACLLLLLSTSWLGVAYKGGLSPRTHLKSPVACAVIWNKELGSLTLYKESNHHYRAISSWGDLVGVLRGPSFVPGLFLRHAARGY